MRLEITHGGVYLVVNDKEQEQKIGTVIDVEGDEVPKNLINKCRVVATEKGKKLATNEAKE